MASTTSSMAYQPVPLTRILHKEVYRSIDPTQPHLSKAGQTVLVTGGTSGIGYAIAKGFALAGADRVIITGRCHDTLATACRNFAADLAVDEQGRSLKNGLDGRLCQVAIPESIDKLFDDLGKEGIFIDVLVLNAALNVGGKLCDQGWEKTWAQFEVNVRALHHLYDRFSRQENVHPKPQYVVNVSSGAIHDFGRIEGLSTYSLTKNAGTLLLQKLASEVDAAKTQIVSFHPGAVFTEQIRDKGMTETSLNWDDASLPGAFAVWCASPAASFLHGRFVWAAWDVHELEHGHVRDRLRDDADFLRIGVHGL